MIGTSDLAMCEDSPTKMILRALASDDMRSLQYDDVIMPRISSKGDGALESPTILDNPQRAYQYARNVIKGRWAAAEQKIVSNPQWAFYYAKDIIGARWPEAEQTISSEPYWIYYYAKYVINGRWEAGEEALRQHTHTYLWDQYKEYILSSSVVTGYGISVSTVSDYISSWILSDERRSEDQRL